MKKLVGLLAALTMVAAPAFAKTVPVHRAHQARVSHAGPRAHCAHRARIARRAKRPKKTGVVEQPNV